MQIERKTVRKTVGISLLLTAIVLIISSLSVSAASVTPTLVSGNPSCQDLGYGFGFKLDFNPPDGNYIFDDGSGNSVTVDTDGNATLVSWSATISIDAVIMKGGSNSNVYTYNPESIGDTNLVTPNAGPEISHIEFCYDYELMASKTATTSWVRTYTWEITKDVSPSTGSGFPGDTIDYHYTVTPLRTETDSAFVISGTVTVTNPSPFTVNFSVSDLIGGVHNAPVTCPTLSVGAGLSVICTYSTDISPGEELAFNQFNGQNNVATVTSSTVGVSGVSASALVSWSNTPSSTVGFETVTVTDTPDAVPGFTGRNFPGATDGQVFNYTQTYTCSTDLTRYSVGNMYSETINNTAVIVEENDLNDSDSETVTANCYMWDVSKTADGTYNNQYQWDITKTVSPTSQSGFAGDTLSWEWTITWLESLLGEENHAVTGVITVHNPANIPLTVAITDELTGNFGATVTCIDGDLGTSLTIAANSSGMCNYTAAPGSQLAQNTVTASRNGISDSATVTVNWVQLADQGRDATIDDSSDVLIPSNAGQSFTYTESVDCSTTEGDYGDNGMYSGSAYNNATITWDGGYDNDDATSNYTCYLWDVSKTADGTFNNRYAWTITKTVDPETQAGFSGDTLSWEWSIAWDSYFVTAENHAVTGVITVDNPADLELTVDVIDVLTGDFAATVVCNDGDSGTSLTIAANSSGTCSYTATPGSQLAQNTATATRNTVSVSDTVNVNWVQNPDTGLNASIDDSSDVTIPLAHDPQPFTYTESVTCSVDDNTYDAVTGSYNGFADNTATITWDGGEAESSAHTDYTCYDLDVSKTASTSVDRTYQWDLSKGVSPDAWELFVGESATSEYTVTLTPLGNVTGDWTVFGDITISNPAPIAANLDSVSDLIDASLIASVDCGGASSVPVNGELVCSYSYTYLSAPADDYVGSNVATAVTITYDRSGDVPVQSGTLSHSNNPAESFDFTAPATDDEFNKTVHVTDDFENGGQVSIEVLTDDAGDSGTVTAPSGGSWVYTRTFTCGEDHVYENIARLIGDNDAVLDSDTASVDVDCYTPSVTKTVDTTFDRDWLWDIDKDSNETNAGILEGDDPGEDDSNAGNPLLLSFGQNYAINYSIFVSAYAVDDNWAVNGQITVNNPHPNRSMQVTNVIDELSTGETVVVVCPPDTTIAPSGSMVCLYQSVELANADARTNTTTATQQLYNFDQFGFATLGSTADYSNSPAEDVAFDSTSPTNTTNLCVDILDTLTIDGIAGATELLREFCASNSSNPLTFSASFNYTRDVLITSDAGCGEHTIDNTAVITADGEPDNDLDSDDVNLIADIDCDAGCSLTIGYWKTHSSYGPAPEDDTWLLLGDRDGDGVEEGPDEQFYGSEYTWLSVMWEPVAGRPYFQLAKQYVGAVLNGLNGADTSVINDTLADATDWFLDGQDPDARLRGRAARGIRRWASTLDSYNMGDIGPGHCDEDHTSGDN